MIEPICEELTGGLSSLFECGQTERGEVRVRTPFLYPDGGVVDVFVVEQGDRFAVTDFGEALGWLRLQSARGRLSPKQRRMVEDVCLTLGVELFKGQLLARVDDVIGLPDAVMRLGQAVVRVGDLWFTMRTRAVESVSDEVADYLDERGVAYDRGVGFTGRSQRRWTVDFQTKTPERSTLVQVLATGSRAATRRLTEHVLASWVDLEHLRASQIHMRFVSLFDDTEDVWSEEDYLLVETASDIARWTRPDELERLLHTA